MLLVNKYDLNLVKSTLCNHKVACVVCRFYCLYKLLTNFLNFLCKYYEREEKIWRLSENSTNAMKFYMFVWKQSKNKFVGIEFGSVLNKFALHFFLNRLLSMQVLWSIITFIRMHMECMLFVTLSTITRIKLLFILCLLFVYQGRCKFFFFAF